MRLFLLQIKIPLSIFTVLLFLVFSNDFVSAQTKVANFFTGRAGTKSYEHISFSFEDDNIGDITYTYGKNGHPLKLKYVGTDNLGGIKAIKVEFPNGEVFFVVPKSTFLRISNKKINYDKIFRWEYDGSVNGIGTWCDSCIDEKESINLIKKHFH